MSQETPIEDFTLESEVFCIRNNDDSKVIALLSQNLSGGWKHFNQRDVDNIITNNIVFEHDVIVSYSSAFGGLTYYYIIKKGDGPAQARENSTSAMKKMERYKKLLGGYPIAITSFSAGVYESQGVPLPQGYKPTPKDKAEIENFRQAKRRDNNNNNNNGGWGNNNNNGWGNNNNGGWGNNNRKLPLQPATFTTINNRQQNGCNNDGWSNNNNNDGWSNNNNNGDWGNNNNNGGWGNNNNNGGWGNNNNNGGWGNNNNNNNSGPFNPPNNNGNDSV